MQRIVCTNKNEAIQVCYNYPYGSEVELRDTIMGTAIIQAGSQNERKFTVFLPSIWECHPNFEQYLAIEYGSVNGVIHFQDGFPGWHHTILVMLIEDLYTLRMCTICQTIFTDIKNTQLPSCQTCNKWLQRRSVMRIARAFRKAISNPEYLLCRSRLQKEYNGLIHGP